MRTGWTGTGREHPDPLPMHTIATSMRSSETTSAPFTTIPPFRSWLRVLGFHPTVAKVSAKDGQKQRYLLD
jgi:hypothetical protein